MFLREIACIIIIIISRKDSKEKDAYLLSFHPDVRTVSPRFDVMYAANYLLICSLLLLHIGNSKQTSLLTPS